MVIAPVIFCTVADRHRPHGRPEDVRPRGPEALVYFEVVSTFALIIGLVVGNVIQPGAGFNIDPSTLDPKIVADYPRKAHGQSSSSF